MYEQRFAKQMMYMNFEYPTSVSRYLDNGVVCELKEKYILHWNYRGLTELPLEILYGGEHVQEIYLKCNNLKQLPDWLHRLSCLRNLYLQGNSIAKLPDTIGGMPSLSVLDLQNNCLYELTPEIGNLKCLSQLNLQYNYLETIPKEISKLKSLILLNLKGNKLTEICEDICSLNSLQELILDENKISILPNNIVYLANLQYLSLDGNKIKYLPFVTFINKPLLSIASNSYLNYLSYDLGCAITSQQSTMLINGDQWNFNCIGCFKEKMTNLRGNILDIPSFQTRIILPNTLRKVYDENVKFIPSLFELSLRCSYSFYFLIDDLRECLYVKKVTELPTDLSSHFWAGPIALCQYCKEPIFTEAILWVFPRQIFHIKPGSPECFLAVMFFCKLSCTIKFRSEEIFVKEYHERMKIELINWSNS